MDASQSSLGIEIFRQIQDAKAIDHLVLGKTPCFEINKMGLGPYIQFEDNSIKFDLSTNILNNPLGYNFPAFIKIMNSEDSNLLSLDKIKNELKSLLNLKEGEIYLSSKNENSLNFKFFQNNKIFDQETKNGISLPFFKIHLCSGNMIDDDSINLKDANKFLSFIKFLTSTNFLKNPELMYSKSLLILQDKTQNFKKINDFCFQLPETIFNNIESLNVSGIYLNDKYIYFPLSLHSKELVSIFEIINN